MTKLRRYKTHMKALLKKNRAVTGISVLCVSLGLFFDFFFHLRINVLRIGPAWSTILIRNIKRWNFCEQNLQYSYQWTTVTTSLNFRNGKPLEESKYQATFHFIAMMTSTQWLPVLKAPLLENEPSEPVEEVLRHRFCNRYPQTETIGLGLGHRVC